MKKKSVFNTVFATAIMAVMLMIPQISWADSSATAASASEFNAAAAAATENLEITLTDDITGNLVVPEGKSVKLILNNHNITAESGVVITNNGSLSIEGEGTVTAGTSYAVVNHGEMGIYGGTFNKADPTKTASLIENGWYNAEDRPENASAVMVIHDGTFDGGTYTALKNDSYGTMVILGGTINTTPNAYDLYNVIGVQECGTVLSIKGGTFNCGIQLENTSSYEGEEKGVMIQGGTFNGDVKTKGISTASAIKAASVSLAITKDAVFNRSLSISNSGAPADTNPFVLTLFQVKKVGGSLTFAGRDSSTPMEIEDLSGLTIGGGLTFSNTSECTVFDTVVEGSSGIKAGNVILTNVKAKSFSNNAKNATASIADGCVIEKVNPTYNEGNTLNIIGATITSIQNTGTNKNAGFDNIEISGSDIGTITTSKGNLYLYGATVDSLVIEDKYVSTNPIYVYIDGGTKVTTLTNNRASEEEPNTNIELSPALHFDDEGNLVHYPALLNGEIPYESFEDIVNDCMDGDIIEIYAPAELTFPEEGHNAIVSNFSGGDITINGRTLGNNDNVSVEVVLLKNKIDQLASDKQTLEQEKTTLTTNLTAATTRAETAEASVATLQTQLTAANNELATKQAEYLALLATYNTATADLAQAQADLTTAQTALAAKQTELENAQAALTAKQTAYDELLAAHTATTAELSQAQADLATAQTALTTKQTELEAAQAALTEKQNAYDTLLAQYNTTAADLATAQTALAAKQTELESAQALVAEKQAAYETLLATHNATTAELTQAQTDLANAQTALTAKQAEYTALLEQNTNLSTQLSAAQTAVAEKQAAYEALLATHNATTAELSQAQTDLINAQTALTAKQAECATLLEQNTNLTTQLTDAQTAVAAAQANVTSLTSQLTAKQAELDEKTAEVTSLTTQLNEKTTALNQAVADKTTLQNQLAQAQTDLETLIQEKAALEAENNALRAEKENLRRAKEEAERAQAEAEAAAEQARKEAAEAAKAKKEAEEAAAKAKADAEAAAAAARAEFEKYKAEQAARQAAAEAEAAAAKAELARIKAQKIAAAYTPAKVSFTKATAGSRRAFLKFKKVPKNVTGYQIRLVDTKTKKVKTVHMKKSNKKVISKTVKGLRKNATYRINIRAYNKVSGQTCYGAWSNTRTVKVR